ncbi:integral membrane protein [Colletotrichum acutatum]
MASQPRCACGAIIVLDAAIAMHESDLFSFNSERQTKNAPIGVDSRPLLAQAGAPISPLPTLYHISRSRVIDFAADVCAVSSFPRASYEFLRALAFLIPFPPIIFAMMRYGLGRDIWTLQPYEITMFLKPFQHYWNGWDGEQDGHCADLNTIGLTHVAFNIALDVWMLILPATQLYKLNMELKKKIGVMAMFSVGIFLTSVSIVRIKSLLVFATSFNITAECLWGIIWSYVELCVGIFVACMPAARQLAWRFFPKLVTYTRESLTGSSKSKREVQNEELTPIAKGRQSSKSGTLSSNITQSNAGSVMDPNTPRSATFGHPQSDDAILLHEGKERVNVIR